MINKDKLFDTITVVSICGTILIILTVIAFKIFNNNTLKNFITETASVYDMAIKQNKEDMEAGYSVEEYSFYKVTAIMMNKDILKYVVEFNQKTNELDYLCVSNGRYKIMIEGQMNKETILESQVINSKKECEFRDEK